MKDAGTAEEGKKDQKELLVGEGEVELFQQEGRFFLSQGEVAVDITGIIGQANYQMGQLVLNVRLSGHQGTEVSNDSRDWLKKTLRAPGPEFKKHQEAGFTKVSGTEAEGGE